MDQKVKLLDGKIVAQKIAEEIKSSLQSENTKPRLDIFLIGNKVSSMRYVELKKKKASEVGVNVVVRKYEETISQQLIISEIETLNQTLEVNGIMVQLPLPKHFETAKILNTISSKKDVDGLTAISLGSAFNCLDNSFLSATAYAIGKLLKSHNIEIQGKDVVILGTSVEVGLPTSAYFFCHGATVQMCNLETKDIKEKAKLADILICATGNPGFVTSEFVKDGAVVIDVGFTLLDGKIFGDVDFESVKEVASYISPVPGGIGPLTVSCLLKNTFKAFTIQKNE